MSPREPKPDHPLSQAQGIERPYRLTHYMIVSTLLAVATSYAMHVVNLRMQHVGISETYIGISAALQALGIVLAAPLTPSLTQLIGFRAAFLAGVVSTASALVFIGVAISALEYSIARTALACGLAIMFTISETLVVTNAGSVGRSKIIGLYATLLTVGTASGPGLILLTGVDGSSPLVCAASLFSAGAVVTLYLSADSYSMPDGARKSSFTAIRAVPAAFVTAFVFGLVDNGGLSMMSVYSALEGYTAGQAGLFAATAIAGGIALQLPLAYAANGGNSSLVLLACGATAAILLTLLPFTIHIQPLAFAVAFTLGGILEGLYTAGLILISKHCREIGVSVANGCFISICSLGELFGPLITGSSMGSAGAPGFVESLTLIMVVYVAAIACLCVGKPVSKQAVTPSF